ncbi:NF-kappa-B inhibitor-like protein 1 isoform 2-T2 [Pelodytes ibericus]
MSFHRELRALRYVQRGDVLRLKSYIRRHRHLCLDEPLPGAPSLLHAACTIHGEACALLLLRKGADPLKRDAAGNNALHVAAREAEKGGWTVYTDLVVPILKRCPQSLDAPNLQGTTPREILRRVEDLMDLNSQLTAHSKKSTKESASPETWRCKLLAESLDEYQEAFGQYDDDFSDSAPEVETFESWADRIFREHQTKTHQSAAGRPCGQTPKPQAKDTQWKLDEQRYRERQQEMERELRKAKNERYQDRCQEVFGATGTKSEEQDTGDIGNRSAKENGTKKGSSISSRSNIDPRTGVILLGYSDIPWPVPRGTPEQMAQEIAAGGNSSDTAAYKRYLRAQQVTWHPDRFSQRCGTRLLAEDRERVLGTVTALSQELNRIAEQAK